MKKINVILVVLVIIAVCITKLNITYASSLENDTNFSTERYSPSFILSDNPAWVLTLKDGKCTFKKLPVIYHKEYGYAAGYDFGFGYTFTKENRNGLFDLIATFKNRYVAEQYIINTNTDPITYIDISYAEEDVKFLPNNIAAIKLFGRKGINLYDFNSNKEFPLRFDHGKIGSLMNATPQFERYFFNVFYSESLEQYFMLYDRNYIDENGEVDNKKLYSANLAVFNKDGGFIKRIPLNGFYYSPDIKWGDMKYFRNFEFMPNSEDSLYISELITKESLSEYKKLEKHYGSYNNIPFDKRPTCSPISVNIDSGEINVVEHLVKKKPELPYVVESLNDRVQITSKSNIYESWYLKGHYKLIDYSVNDKGVCDLIFANEADIKGIYYQ